MAGGALQRIKELTRASPGEVGLVALLGLVVVAGSAVVYARTSEPPAPKIVRSVESSHHAQVAKKLVVHVAGMVATPGVYELDEGSRVRDAIAAAGGPSAGADVNALNLAALLSDGQKVVVPVAGQVPSASSEVADATGKINLNTATKEELEQLPSIGPELAQRIIDFRQRKRFTSARQLLEVQGIGPKKFEALKDLITV